MNRIVKRHLPVAELPKDWRNGLPADARVSVEISVESEPFQRQPIARLVGVGRNVHGVEERIIGHIRQLRDDR